VEKRKIVDRIIEELSGHAAIEEQVFDPVTRATVPAVEKVALESLEEHHVVKWLLSELEDVDPEDERFDAKVRVVIESVRHHVREEESEYFREVRSELGTRPSASWATPWRRPGRRRRHARIPAGPTRRRATWSPVWP
jgi:biotin synthase-related radical SAM superfamily protein